MKLEADVDAATGVRVKICGITNSDDAICACSAGTDFLGFIFVEKSPRYVTYEKVRRIVTELDSWLEGTDYQRPKLCGVYVNSDPQIIQDALHDGLIDYAQLHGDEPLRIVQSFRGRSYKAIRPTIGDANKILSVAKSYASAGATPGPSILVDAYSPDTYGGTGEKADWTLAAGLATFIEGFVLAGGLTPENVAGAVTIVHPWAVDASSGVERSPGLKDHDAVRQFVQAAKQASLD